MKKAAPHSVYGLVAQFDTPEALVKAAEKVRDQGYTHTDAFSPFPVHGIIDALGVRRTKMSSLVLAGGVVGFAAGLGLQYWVSSIAYPHVVAGRPFFSWPNFVPVVFECTVLFAALTAFIGMLVRNGLPRPYHPIFAAPGIERATVDKFVLCVEASDPQFHLEKTTAFLRSLNPERVESAPIEASGEDQRDGRMDG